MRNVDEEKELERFEIVRNLVRTKLQETGDLERLRYYVRQKLAASGWKNDMMKELRAVVNEKGVCNVTVQNLYDKICIRGRKIDPRVEDDILRKIKHCYREAICKDDSNEIDPVSAVLSNDTIGNNLYINEHRN